MTNLKKIFCFVGISFFLIFIIQQIFNLLNITILNSLIYSVTQMDFRPSIGKLIYALLFNTFFFFILISATFRELIISLGKKFFFITKNYYINATILSIISFLVFFIFKAKKYSGDPLGEAAEKAVHFLSYRFWMSNPISSYFNYISYSISHNIFGWSGNEAVSFLYVIYGALFIFALYLFCGNLTKDKTKQILIFGIIAFAGYIQLFFGYISSTPLATLLTLFYIYSAYLFLKGKVSIMVPSAVLILTFWSHGSTGFFFPSLLFLCMTKIKIDKMSFKNFIKIFINKTFLKIVFIFLIFTLLLFSIIELNSFYAFNTHITNIEALKIGDFGGGGDGKMFVPLYKITARTEKYTMFSINHIIDIINYIIILAPFSLLALIIIFWVYHKSIDIKDPFIFFLLSMILFYMAYFITWNSDSSAFSGIALNTWYIYPLFAIPTLILISYILINYIPSKEDFNLISLIIICVNLLYAIPWILSNFFI